MKHLSKLALALSLTTASGIALANNSTSAVIKHYATIAEATFDDSLTSAQQLQNKVAVFLAAPTEENLAAARQAWIAARVPYQQSEAFRFGNPIVDEWEGKVNAWPLDEGLIDYVDTSHYGEESDENDFFRANVIANKQLQLGTTLVDTSNITPALLSDTLQEIDDIESNVATGYHAVEFLLWGQDLNGTKPGAGARPATDFNLENCTNGNCDRRRDYLKAATDLLVSDLDYMAAQWKEGGEARTSLLERSEKQGLATILTGMGSLSYGELAGERIKLGLMLHDPEEEHDCFSDNTHNSHYYDAKGIQNVYLGTYTRLDGSVLSGPSISQLLNKTAPDVDAALREDLADTQAAMQVMVDEAQKDNTFDVLIASGNTQGNQVIQKIVDALTTQTSSIEKAINALGLENIELEGSDSLDRPETIPHS